MTAVAKASSPGTCHPKIWSRLMALYAARQTAKNRLEDLIRGRKVNDSRLDELGAGEGPDHLRVSRLQILTLRSIDYERARIRELADRIDATINAGINADLEYLKGDDDPVDYKPAMEAELFRAPEPDEDEEEEGESPEKSAKPVGRHPQLKLSDQPQPPEGTDQQLAAACTELDLPEKAKGRLAAEFANIKALADFIDAGKDLREKLNVGENLEREIKKAVAQFRGKHREAARVAEGRAS